MGTGGGVEPSNLISAGVLVPADRYDEALAILDTIARPVADQDIDDEEELDDEEGED
jgi:hypothetical protein